jgi:hypothetical protein
MIERTIAALSLGQSMRAYRAALRVGCSPVLPIAILEVLGRGPWSVYALLASTVAVFGRESSGFARVRMQGEVAVLHVLLIAVGTALSVAAPCPWALIAMLACIAGAGSAIADIRHWRPPGALFTLLVIAVPATRLGTCRSDIAVAFAVSAVSVALVLTVSGIDAACPQSGHLVIPTRREVPRPIATHAIACLAASFVGGVAALWLGFDRPYWAMISAIIPMAADTTRAQLQRAQQRLAGTLAGLVPAALLYQIQMSGGALLAIQVRLMTCTEIFIARSYAVALLFLTPMAIGMALRQPGLSRSTLA